MSRSSLIADVRREAIKAGQRATHRGFLTEADATLLMRRGYCAALRSIDRSRHPDAGCIADEWVPGGDKLDLAGLPPDAPTGRLTEHRAAAELFDHLLEVMPLPDEPGAAGLWRRLGIQLRRVIECETWGGELIQASRITHEGRDRWFFSAENNQDGAYELGTDLPSARRPAVTVDWVGWICTEYRASRVHVDADARTFGAITRTVSARWPDAQLARRR